MTVAMTEMADLLPSGTAPDGRSISVIITAMNEEGNLRPTVDAVVKAIAPRFPQYEVIIIDDGSRDRTPQVAQQLAADNRRIRVHRNPRNMGLAYSYRTGIRLTTGQYTSWVAGNNLVPAEAFERIYDRVGERDMVVTYIFRDVRGRRRRMLSRTFTRSVNLLFGGRLRYYTGPCVYRSDVVKGMRTRAHGSMFVAEVLIRLLMAGQTYVEVGLQPLSRSSGSTKTFRLRNVVGVLASVARLLWELRVQRTLGMTRQSEVRVAHNDPVVPSR
jgi:glycosyltransferase involved in cell wall biosynthesis